MNIEKQKIQEEAFLALQKHKFNGGIILPTGTGKTFVLIQCLKALTAAKTILYCCDNKNLRDKDFPDELKKWGAEHYIDRIERLCYKTAYKLQGQHYDILLLDEGDYCLTPEYIKLLKNNKFKHIIFASATLEGDKRTLLKEFVPIVYEKQIDEIESSGVINKANLYLVNFMLTKDENSRYLSYNEVFKKLLNSDNRNDDRLSTLIRNRKLFMSRLESAKLACQKLISQLYPDKSKKILIFCTISEQADAVCKYSYHSNNAKDNEFLKMFDEGKLRILSVCGKIDRGVNLDGVNCVIFESPAESQTKMIQKSGRARRLDTDEYSDFYFLCPFFKARNGEVKATIVQKWILNSTKEFNQNFKYITI